MNGMMGRIFDWSISGWITKGICHKQRIEGHEDIFGLPKFLCVSLGFCILCIHACVEIGGDLACFDLSHDA